MIDGSDLVVTDATTGTERRVSLATVRSARIARLGNVEICALALEGGREDAIATDERGCRADFAALVRELYAALSPRSVPFARGSWLIAGVVATSCAAGLALGLAVYLGVIDAPQYAVRALVGAIVSAVFGPVGVWTARPRAIRTDAELDAALPR